MDAQRILTLKDVSEMTKKHPLYPGEPRVVSELSSRYGSIWILKMFWTRMDPWYLSCWISLYRLLWWSTVATAYTLTGRYEKSLIVLRGNDGQHFFEVRVRPKG